MAPQVRYLEARLLMERKQWSDAAQHLERIRASLAEWPALQQEADLWLGTCYGKLGRADLQIQAYQNAGRHDPHWIPALLGQADALLAAGRLPEALKQYEAAALRPDAPPGVQLSYVRLLVVVSLKQPTTAETWQQIRQRIDTVRNNPATSREQQRDSDILTAEVLAAQGDLAAAETQLTAAIAADPDCVDFRTTLAGLLLGEKRWDEAERTLQEASERFGDHVALRLARARLLMARHATDADAGERLRAELRTLSQFPPNMPDRDAIALASGLFPMLLVLGDRERAEELQREISMRDPSNLQARLLQFDFALQTKKTDRMEQLLRELERIEGQGPLWRYGNAVRLTLLSETSAKQNRVDLLQQALRELAEAARARPRWERAAYLKGRICDQLQSPDQALQAYEEAFHLGLREPHAIVRLIKLYTEREDLSSAVSVLAQLKKEGAPLSSRLAAAAAELAMKLGSGPQAQDLAELALRLADDARRHSQNFEDHLVYGQILGLTGRSDEAERAFLAARGLAPSEQLPWLLLVQLYKQTNREEEAQRLVTEARDSFGEQDSPLAIAQAYQLLQDVPQAEQHYVQALAAAPDDARVLRTIADFYLRHGKPEQARPLLAHLTSGSAEGASTSDLLWSRRALARLLLGVGDQYEWDEARQLIEQNLPEGGAALEDRRLKAILLSLRPRHDLRLEAIELLEGVLEQSPAPSADDRLVLARLHLAEQAWHRRQSNNAADPDRSADAERHRAEAGRHFAQARELLQKVLAADADHAPAMCLYVHALLANDRTAEAQEWIPRLTPHVAGNLECLTTALDVFRACDGTDEAYSLLNGLAPAEVTPESASLVLTAADLLSAFGTSVQSRQPAAVQRFHERAEELYRLLAGLEPRYHLALAGHCGRIGRTEEALALIEDHAGDASPMELASACVQTLQNAAERNSLRERMDAALAGVIDDSADSIPLRLARADLRAWTGDAAGAEEMYRQVLELAPRHVMAANNLAFLLAWQNKDLDEALRWIETAIAAQGEQPELLDTRACVRLKLAKPDTAIEDLQRALQEATDVAFLYHLSQAHLARNDTQQAQATWKSAQLNGLDESALHPVERDYFRGFVTRIAARE
jgi:Tfp pilus assembly protein PilF